MSIEDMTESGDPEAELRTKFGYGFDDAGVLRKYDAAAAGDALGENRFAFDAHGGDAAENQRRYDSIARVVTRCLYKFLETRAGLRRVSVGGEFVFVSEDFGRNEDRLLVLIHGSG